MPALRDKAIHMFDLDKFLQSKAMRNLFLIFLISDVVGVYAVHVKFDEPVPIGLEASVEMGPVAAHDGYDKQLPYLPLPKPDRSDRSEASVAATNMPPVLAEEGAETNGDLTEQAAMSSPVRVRTAETRPVKIAAIKPAVRLTRLTRLEASFHQAFAGVRTSEGVTRLPQAVAGRGAASASALPTLAEPEVEFGQAPSPQAKSVSLGQPPSLQTQIVAEPEQSGTTELAAVDGGSVMADAGATVAPVSLDALSDSSLVSPSTTGSPSLKSPPAMAITTPLKMP
jgi:hypothetical protein